MKKILVTLLVIAALCLAVPAVASANYLQGFILYGNNAPANGYRVDIQYNWPGIGWGFYGTQYSGQGGAPGAFSQYIGSIGYDGVGRFRIRVCYGGYSSGNWRYADNFAGGTLYVSSTKIYMLFNGC